MPISIRISYAEVRLGIQGQCTSEAKAWKASAGFTKQIALMLIATIQKSSEPFTAVKSSTANDEIFNPFIPT